MSRLLSVSDLSWVPVVRGGDPQVISLREVLRDAHEISDLGTSLLPVEREALLRFLESTVAAILRGEDPDDVSEWTSLPIELIDRFFDDYAHCFELDHADTPFMQEWHAKVDPSEIGSKTVELQQLHLRIPGASSALWGVGTEERDARDPGVLTLLLLVSWFHGKPSNAAGASCFRPTNASGKRAAISGAPSGGPRDTVFHLLGHSLLETLLLNIPSGWLDSPLPPAWLDQDLEPGPVEFANGGGLWRSTWTANRALVVWDADANAIAATRGVTMRFIPPVGAAHSDPIAQVKAHSKAMADDDYCRITYELETKSGGRTRRFVRAPFDLRSTEGFEKWYRGELADALKSWAGRERLQDVAPATRVAFHNEEGDTYGNRKRSEWIVVPLAELAVTGDAKLALEQVLSHVRTAGTAIGTAVRSEFHEDPKGTRPLSTQIRSVVYSALDDLVLEVVDSAARGEVIDYESRRRDVSSVSIRAFATATESLLTPASAGAVHRARSLYSRTVRSKEKRT